MLIRFIIKNFRSFNEETEVLLTPSRAMHLRNHVIPGKRSRDPHILKSALLYGANASGKSNFTKALHLIKKMVVDSTVQNRIDYEPFRLAAGQSDKLSKLEVEFRIGDNNYAFGIDFNRKQIVNEWLYSIDKESDSILYERKTNTKGQVTVSFGNLKLSKDENARLHFMGLDTRPTETFLRAVNARNTSNIKGLAQFHEAYKWFNESLVIIFPDSKYQGLESSIHSNAELKDIYQLFLQRFDTGIAGLDTKKVDFFSSEVNLPKELKENINQDMEDGDSAIVTSFDNIRYSISKDRKGKINAVKLLTQHRVKGKNNMVNFEVNQESDGTQRIMDFIPAMVDIINQDCVFVIDEIDRSLHPKLVHKLFEMFYNNSEGIRSQLLATTHEDHLLDKQLLRSDETWLVEKNKEGETLIKSLAEYKVRSDLDIRKGYINGRFGAIPNLMDIDVTDFTTKRNAEWSRVNA